MRIADIELGVEYCETAPLAYGSEPSVTPNCVRFLDTVPYTWVREWEVDEPVAGRRPSSITTKMRQIGNAYPTTVANARAVSATTESDRFAYAKQQDVGTRFKTYDHTIKGHYLAERKRGDDWVRGLCQSAAVHRTWVEYEKAQAVAKEFRAEVAKNQAPMNLSEGVRKALKAAALIAADYDGCNPADLVREEVRKQTEGG